ncbi:uncharacterized protein I206_107395 [Kwoniella pini CBS 10737]|uniref:Non-structural maintenance of chromosomes element 4 n=1 Tax=Kwoniella pini CBS 10737 TaxID=1296096 RepID=A0A1B9HX80_9TREE|nr:uncharacterized protein I206_05721 [Kwoniella pini CBS 10737]OCF47861.1 hypothetical protein I206_05721 [Kwoniella pini CBS 10737]
MSPEAGPSRRRISFQNGHTTTQIILANTFSTQKRRKITDVNEIFEKPNVEEQIKLNKDYRALQNKAQEMRANLANSTTDDLIQAMSKQEDLFINVKDTGIGALDANLMKTNTENAMALAKKFKIDGVNFDIDEFLLKVKGHLGLDRIELADQDQSSDEDDELEDSLQSRGGGRGVRKGVLGDWDKIGWMAAKFYRRVSGVEFMYGPLSKIHEKKKAGPRQKKKALAPEIRPEEVQQEQGKEKSKDDFTSNVRMVKKVLQKLDPQGEGINFFELIIHPEDFGQSVENCFFVSFLLNQGLAGIDLTDDGEVIIKDTIAHEDMDGDHVAKHQAVVELDIQTWKDAKRIFNITKPSIPHRDYTAIRAQMAGNAWYS